MARCAAAAVLAAIEIYNKPTVEYREQTLALLLTNAWEVLLKARLIQQAGGEIEVIHRHRRGSSEYVRDRQTGEPVSMGLKTLLGRSSIPDEVKINVRSLIEVRNDAAHLGVLSTEARDRILSLGTASVHNFVRLSMQWFEQPVEVPYLLPLGFMGQASIVKATYPGRQRSLLKTLDELAHSIETPSADYSVTLHVHVNFNRGLSGGASIGTTNDPEAPLVRISDNEMLTRYPASYDDVVAMCRKRYSNFLQNQRFNDLMKSVKADPDCAYKRSLNPNSEGSSTTYLYNLDATIAKLDSLYTRNA